MQLETNKHINRQNKSNNRTRRHPNSECKKNKPERSGVMSFKSSTLVHTLANLVETGMSHMMDLKEHLHQDKGI